MKYNLFMYKPNFKELNKKIDCILDLGRKIHGLKDFVGNSDKIIGTACQALLFSYALESLDDISIDELAKSKTGIRIGALKDAGFRTLKDLAKAKDYEISSVEGVGTKQLESIRNIVGEFQRQIAERTPLKIEANDNSPETRNLIKTIYQYTKGNELLVRSKGYLEGIEAMCASIDEVRPIRNGLQWLFSGRSRKIETVEIDRNTDVYLSNGALERGEAIAAEFQALLNLDESIALEDFRNNNAAYYAVIESFGTSAPKPLVYSSLPSTLADSINAYPLNLSEFAGTLREYQNFGAKFILHQNYTLLGDEMGLGKTVEAIAAMAHIYAENRGAYFLVICPAGVLVNWVREIEKFSSIPTFLVHGPTLEESFQNWKQKGGACVTNYETMGKIVGEIDNHMQLDLLVIDEAHYIKNPDAKRTKYIRALENESKRILLMTGTPLENRVVEMCSLIDFIRPDMSWEIRSLMGMSMLPEFKEKVAPIYLRRLRADVLAELPPLEHKAEWCTMTEEDLTAYILALQTRNFNTVRRVSFLQDDMMSSSKAMRLRDIVNEAFNDGRKIIVYSFFRETIDKVSKMLGDSCVGNITGDTPPADRQLIIDKFTATEPMDTGEGMVLVCQIQAGGTGLNIQAASVVVFCEPQIKPSLANQALSRVYRMGQNRNVLVHHLLCADTLDEEMLKLLSSKQKESDMYAEESALAEASEGIFDKEWIQAYMDREGQKYLTMQ